MDSIGQILAQERQRQEKTIEDVEKITKIRKKYLQAIEEEDFQTLPGRAYTVAFIRSYASCLGLDSDPLVSEFEAKTKPLPLKTEAPLWRKYLWKFLLVILAILIGYSILRWIQF